MHFHTLAHGMYCYKLKGESSTQKTDDLVRAPLVYAWTFNDISIKPPTKLE
jgi:hypothetical protein